MLVPYTLVLIKPLSIGRGLGPDILQDILNNTPVSLRCFRSWRICDTSWKALCMTTNSVKSDIDYESEKIHAVRPINTWACIFTHRNRVTDPTDILIDICGPLNYTEWSPRHLRYRYSGDRKKDTVFHISNPSRVEYESSIVFLDFDSSII